MSAKKTLPTFKPLSRLEPGAIRAHDVLRYTYDSAHSMLSTFDILRKGRSKKGGATTDEEQDCLRAMLVFVSAGLDAMLKHLIKESIFLFVERDKNAYEEWHAYIRKRLKYSPASESSDSVKFLAQILTAEKPRSALIEAYINILIGNSLQSTTELIRTLKAFGIETKRINGFDDKLINPFFEIRNKIIHELDINFDHPQRNRELRSREKMVESCSKMMNILFAILEFINNQICLLKKQQIIEIA